MANHDSVIFVRSRLLREQIGIARARLASQASMSDATLKRMESGLPVSRVKARAIFRVIAKEIPDLNADNELVQIDRTPLAGTSSISIRSANVLDQLTSPLVIGVALGDACAQDIAEFFHELSVLHQMVGGSGLDFSFEETRELERIAA